MTYYFSKKVSLILIIAVVAFQQQSRSQESNMLQYFSGISQSSLLNPAHQNTNEKLVIGLPLLSGVHVGWNANFTLNSIFENDFSYSIGKFYDSLNKEGKARVGSNISIFYASFKRNDWNYTMSVQDKFSATTTFERDILTLIRDGNVAYYGTNTNFGSGSFSFKYYRELSFGISKQIWKNLAIGLRPKVLFGKLFLNANDINISAETNLEKEELLLIPSGSFTLTGPFKYNILPEMNFTNFSADIVPGDYFFNLRNMGLGIDFGMSYRPDPYTEISGSILDLGFIGLKYKTYKGEFKEGIHYSADDLYQSTDIENTKINYQEPKEALKSFGDSISYNIKISDASLRSFEPLPIKINLAVSRKLSKRITLGAINQFTNYNGHSADQLSGYINGMLRENFEFTGSVALYNFSKIWIGLGGSYTAKNFQVYLLSNNILGIIRPSATNDLNLCFGVNLLFETQN